MQIQCEMKGISLDFHPVIGIPHTIKSDRKRLLQVLYNLISNAIKFTFEGGITVTMEKVENHLKLTVKDSGIGINQEDLANLFKCFGQLESSRHIN